jgi:HlyD family secretion protein
LRKPLVGKVESVGMMVGKNQVVGLSPTSGSDLRVVKVRIAVEPSQEAARLVNLQVRAKIDTRRARSSGAAAARTPAP